MLDPPPRVTILTAAFNAREGLRETVESVAGQSFRAREHVVVDGGSSDGSRAYLESLGDSVRWVSEPDDGIADALNKGLALARGEWVLVLQAEDTFADGDSLARATAHLCAGADIVACDILLDCGGVLRRLSAPRPARRLAFKPLHHQGLLCRRALFGRIGGFDPAYRICMDYEHCLRALRAGASVSHAPELLSRMPATGVSSRRDWLSLRARFDEERRAQLKHCPGSAMRAVYAVYWPLYLGYRRARAALAG